jgi:Uma2 family endonuclease
MPAAHRIPTEPDAFIAWENRQKARYELIDGVPRLMRRGTLARSRIAANLVAALHGRQAGRRWSTHGSDLKLRSPTGAVVYPDVLVHFGRVPNGRGEIDKPVLVAQVLSRSAKSRDAWAKRHAYMAMRSLRHLLLVWPESCYVNLETRRKDGTWLLSLHCRLGDELTLEALGVTLPLAEIYAGTRVAGAADG